MFSLSLFCPDPGIAPRKRPPAAVVKRQMCFHCAVIWILSGKQKPKWFKAWHGGNEPYRESLFTVSVRFLKYYITHVYSPISDGALELCLSLWNLFWPIKPDYLHFCLSLKGDHLLRHLSRIQGTYGYPAGSRTWGCAKRLQVFELWTEPTVARSDLQRRGQQGGFEPSNCASTFVTKR